jgi:DNA-directed RNA polymerase specialized sigma24 family protein
VYRLAGLVSFLSPSRYRDSIPKLNPLSARDYIQALYRFALIQTGRGSNAEIVVQDIIGKAFQQSERSSETANIPHLFRTAYAQRESFPRPESTELQGWPRALHNLPEPSRSALTLFYLEVFSPSTIAEIVELPIEKLADLVTLARQSLANR